MSPEFEPLLNAAVRAPSGDNTQPWRIAIDPAAGVVDFAVDEARDPSPMNAGQRMARIAIGAAVENLLRVAEARGWDGHLDPAGGPGLVRVRLRPGPGDPDRSRVEEVEKAIVARVTNRRVYERRPAAPELIAHLKAHTPPLDGTTTHWITDEARLTSLARLIGRSDAAMFGDPSMRRAFLSKVRFDLPPDAPAEDGLPLGSLEASRFDRLALRLMRKTPNWLLKYSGGLGVFAAKARQLIESASGVCLVVAGDRTPQADVVVGRATQRAWLALAERGLAAQPMMSLPVLENVVENGAPEVVASVGRDRVTALSDEFRALVPEVGGGRPAWLMRFGYAPPPSGAAGRLPLRDVVREATTI